MKTKQAHTAAQPQGGHRAAGPTRRGMLGLLGSAAFLVALGPHPGLASEDTISVRDALDGARS